MMKKLIGVIMKDGATGYPEEHALLEREMEKFLGVSVRLKKLQHVAKLLEKQLGAKSLPVKLVKRAIRKALKQRQAAQSAKTKDKTKKKKK